MYLNIKIKTCVYVVEEEDVETTTYTHVFRTILLPGRF